MDKEDLKYFGELIRAKIQTIQEDLGHFEANAMSGTLTERAGDLSVCAYATHRAGGSTDATGQEGEFSFAQRESRFRDHLNEALRRIENGTYGICRGRNCGTEIGRARLEAVPHATLCIRCKKAEEQAARDREVWCGAMLMREVA